MRRLIIAVLVGIIAVPLSTTALFLQQEIFEKTQMNEEDLRTKATQDRRRLRGQRRLYWQAIEQFQMKKKQGLDAVKPDINNLDSIYEALEDPKEQELNAAAPEVTSLTTDQLESHDRSLLRRYTRAGFCPDSLKNFSIEGFYELCVSLVGIGAKKDPVTGLLNHSAYIIQKLKKAGPEESGFKLRMKMMREARDSGNRRSSGVLPGRPTTCVMNPLCLIPRSNN